MKIDIRGLKKVSSDDKTSTFKTAKGHTFIVAHNALSKTGSKALQEIPAMYQESDTPNYSNVSRAAQPQQMAQGGGIGGQNQPMFHGVKGQIANWAGNGNPGLPTQLPAEAKAVGQEMDMTGRTAEPMGQEEYNRVNAPVQSEDIGMAKGGMIRRYAGGTPDAPVSAQDASLKKLGLTNSKAAINAAPLPAEQADPTSQGAIGAPSPYATATSGDEAFYAGNPQAALPAASAVGGYSLPGGMADLPMGYQTQLKGLQEEKQGAQMGTEANVGLAQEQAHTYGSGINRLNDLNNQYITNYQDIQQQRQALMKEAQTGAQHLDPNNYIKKMSTGGSILTVLGLIAGGMGAGMTHGPNLAYDMLEKNIDRDVQNQRTQLGTTQNLLSFNLQNSGDLREAMATTKMNHMDMLGMYLKRQAALAQNPLQQAALMNQSGMIDQKAGELQNNIARMRTFMQLGAQGNNANSEGNFQSENGLLRVMGPEGAELAKNREEKHVAGVGQASRAVPPDVLSQITARNSLDGAITDLQQFASGHSGSINPADIAQGHAKAALAQDMARQASNAGVFKESEKDFMNKYIGENPTQLFEKYRAGKGYEEVRKNNLNQLNQLKQTYGLPVSQKQVQAQQSPQEVERLTKDKKIAVFDANTKKFLRYK